MELMLLRMYQQHVEEQCLAILQASQAIEAAPGPNVWLGLQLFVVATANVSKLLWGQSIAHAAVRQPLRASIGIEDSSPLRSRHMRNNFEHIDERLDAWWKDCPNHNIADRNIGPYPMIVGLQEKESFRLYDPTTGSLWFWGDAFNVRDIVAEVQRIYPTLKRETEKPHWVP